MFGFIFLGYQLIKEVTVAVTDKKLRLEMHLSNMWKSTFEWLEFQSLQK